MMKLLRAEIEEAKRGGINYRYVINMASASAVHIARNSISWRRHHVIKTGSNNLKHLA